jgi:hypothetical protein
MTAMPLIQPQELVETGNRIAGPGTVIGAFSAHISTTRPCVKKTWSTTNTPVRAPVCILFLAKPLIAAQWSKKANDAVCFSLVGLIHPYG